MEINKALVLIWAQASRVSSFKTAFFNTQYFPACSLSKWCSWSLLTSEVCPKRVGNCSHNLKGSILNSHPCLCLFLRLRKSARTGFSGDSEVYDFDHRVRVEVLCTLKYLNAWICIILWHLTVILSFTSLTVKPCYLNRRVIWSLSWVLYVFCFVLFFKNLLKSKEPLTRKVYIRILHIISDS